MQIPGAYGYGTLDYVYGVPELRVQISEDAFPWLRVRTSRVMCAVPVVTRTNFRESRGRTSGSYGDGFPELRGRVSGNTVTGFRVCTYILISGFT